MSTEGGQVRTAKEFKKWLEKFDSDRNGRISKEELQDAIRFARVWFSMWKSNHAVKVADDEMNNLVEFAKKILGVKI